MATKEIDIGEGNLDIKVNKKLVLHIKQMSGVNVVSFHLYPKVRIVRNCTRKSDAKNIFTHEIIIPKFGR